jgi:hypothetical protein
MASEAVLKGWNGNLRISDEGVTITRGLKGFLRRDPRRQPLDVSYTEIRRVRFMAATKVVGYVQVLTTDAAPPDDRRGTLNNDHTLTFTKRRSDACEKIAVEIARRSRVDLERVTPPEYWATVHELAPQIPRGFAFGRIKVQSAKPIDSGNDGDNSGL